MSHAGAGPMRIKRAAKRRFTYDQLLAELPETTQPHELWSGELIMAPAPFFEHQKIVLRFFRKLDDWASKQGGEAVVAPIDMVLSTRCAVQPDVAYVAPANLGIIRDAIRGAADLVAEVVSPASRYHDRIKKKALYEKHGVKEYWIIDPEQRMVEVLWLGEGGRYTISTWAAGDIARSHLLEHFTVAVNFLFHIGAHKIFDMEDLTDIPDGVFGTARAARL